MDDFAIEWQQIRNYVEMMTRNHVAEYVNEFTFQVLEGATPTGA